MPNNAGLHVASLRLRQIANAIPKASASDVVKLAICPELAQSMFNPCLRRTGLGFLRDAVSMWLQLCVLSDKLDRLIAYVLVVGGGANLLL
jgi:hypothetical protein